MRRLTFREPWVLTNVIVQQLVNDSLDHEGAVWLLRFTDGDSGSGSLTIRLGAGAADIADDCGYSFLGPESAYPPADLRVIDSAPEFLVSGDSIPYVELPLWEETDAYPDPPLAVLPLAEVMLAGRFDGDGLFIGQYDDRWLADWVPGGMLLAKIRVADALDVEIGGVGMTLCAILSGDSGPSSSPADDCLTDPERWRNPPDTTVGDEPAWRLTAEFAASPVRIAGD